VQRLRELLRDRGARDAEGLFVCEGPRVIEAALDHGAALLECFVGEDASTHARSVAERCAAARVPCKLLRVRVGDTRTPQPVFALARLERRGIEGLRGADLVVVATEVADPGNAGTLFRSAAGAGAQAVVLGPGSVDAYNPKVVRASAGACFAIELVEAVPTVEVLELLGAGGVRRLGAVAHGGDAPESFDMRGPTALVLGHETRGLASDASLDALVTIPVRAAESLNVAMAGTALLYEAARQRRSGA
jgi:TrmH family RNA methyltransferase